MIRVLVNAYSCSPDMGSEPGMAWNWCVNLAKHCELHIITEGEFREKIEVALPTLPQRENLHFYYNPIPEQVRDMCRNQGDWRFYYYYRKWQKRTLCLARNIMREHKIDLIHQLNMVGFREPGYLWEITDIPLVWGPIAGIQHIPFSYLHKLKLRFATFFLLKNTISKLQLRFDSRVRAMIKRAEEIIVATPEMQRALLKYHDRESVLINETACADTGADTGACVEAGLQPTLKSDSATFNIIWVGKFDARKQLDLALETIQKVKYLDIRFHIVGTGATPETTQYYHHYAQRLGIAHLCVWHGQIPHQQVLEHMREADLFFFTSISEATSTVVMEAIQSRLPVLCFNTCGFGPIVTPEIGIRIALRSPEQAVVEFAEKIAYLYHNRAVLERMSKNTETKQKELGWEYKTAQVIGLYKQLFKC